jgi:tetratricopeptide (TPR) repeat protein
VAETLISDEVAEKDLLACATRVAETIKFPEAHGAIMSRISARYASAGDFEFAVQLADTIMDPFARDQALANIAVVAAGDGDFDYAIELVDSLDEVAAKAEGLAGIARIYARARRYDESLDIAKDVNDSSLVYSEIALACANNGDCERAMEITGLIDPEDDNPAIATAIGDGALKCAAAGKIVVSLAMVRLIGTDSQKAWALLRLVEGNPGRLELGAEDVIQEALGLIKGQDEEAALLAAVAATEAARGKEEAALNLLSRSTKLAPASNEGDRALVMAGEEYAKLGRMEEAVNAIEKIEDPIQACLGWLSLAGLFHEAGELSRAKASLNEARRIIEEELRDNEDTQMELTCSLALQEATTGNYDSSIETAGRILLEPRKNEVLTRIAIEAAGGNLERAINTANLLTDEASRALALASVAETLLERQEQAEAVRALQRAREASQKSVSPHQKVRVLIRIGDVYGIAGDNNSRDELLAEALEAARAIRDESHMAGALLRLSEKYDEAGFEISGQPTEVLREIILQY